MRRYNDRVSDRVQEPRPKARWYDEEIAHDDERDGWGRPAPAKLTRTSEPTSQRRARHGLSGKRTLLAEPGAASPEHTLQYSQWLLAAERGWSGVRTVQRRATDERTAPDDGALASAFGFLSGSSGAGSLPAELARQLRELLGVDATRIRLHTDDRAAAAAELLHARAFTLGEDLYFAAGAYDPHSEAGLELLAHEVAHVAQYQRGSAPSGGGVSRAGDHHELEADELARRFLVERGRRQAQATSAREGAASSKVRKADEAGAPWWGDPAAPSAPAAAAPAPSAPAAAAPQAPPASVPSASSSAVQRKAAPAGAAKAAPTGAAPLPEVVDLLATSSFEPSAAIAAHIDKAGKAGAQVRVKLGALGSGIIRVKKAGKNYVTLEDKPQIVPLSSSLFVPLPGLSPVVRVRIGARSAGSITGYAAPEASAGNERALQKALGENPEAIGLRGFELPHLQLTNKLENGTLTLASQKAAQFSLGGWVDGTLSFGVINSTVTLDAHAHLHARGIKDAELAIARDAQGHLHGSVDLALDLGDKFSGSARATYENGDVAVKGELGYHSEKFSGKLGLIVADAAQAEQMVRAQIDPMGVMPLGKVGGEPAKAPRTKKGERAIAGWGELDFAFTDWLTGKAMVVYGPTGHLTVVGKIAPPKRLDLMKTPKGFKRPIMPEVNIEASYGLPYIADIHVGIGVSLSAEAELGPIYMSDLAIEGLYSTDPAVMNAFSITGALRAQAHAGLELDVKGYAGLRILKHSVNVGAGIKGNAGVRAYAEARPTLGYREIANPTAGKQGEYYLKGHLEMAAQPVLSLGGRLFIELDSPWWSPAPDKTWEWPIGNLEYPMPTQLGVGADIDYVVGSDNWPELKLSQPSFDASKFVDSMMDDRLPKKSGAAGDQDKKGDWKGVAPTAPTAAPPTVAKTPAKDTAPTAGTPSKKAAKGKQLPDEQKNVPQTKDAGERWTAGMEALGELRKRSEKDPETSAEIHQHLAELKSRFGFTGLRADRSGDQWLVDADLNPSKKDIPIKADPKEKEEGKGGAGGKDKGDDKSRKAELTQKVKEREALVERLLRATTYDKEKYGHLAKLLFDFKKPLSMLHGSIDTASGPEELKMATDDVTKGLKDIDPQLATYQAQLAHAEERRDAAEKEIDKDREQWKDRERWENAKKAVSAILAEYKESISAAVPGVRIMFRGSLATGWKGPHKVDTETGAARRFNPHDFDCDAFLEIPIELWSKELIRTRLLPPTRNWARIKELREWPRAAALHTIEQTIRSKLTSIEGYKQDAGEPHFDMTLQTDEESLAKLQGGNVYPNGALKNAGANPLEDSLPSGRVRDTNEPGKMLPETVEEI